MKEKVHISKAFKVPSMACAVMSVSCLINMLSSNHEHFRSFTSEGLWGFPDNDVNRKRWSTLHKGSEALLYFEHNRVKGIWGLARVLEVFENRNRVSYWVEDPTGFPLQVRLELIKPIRYRPTPQQPLNVVLFNAVTPLERSEVAAQEVGMLKTPADRWSLVTFGEKSVATYEADVFKKLKEAFLERNTPVNYALKYIETKFRVNPEEEFLKYLGHFSIILAQEKDFDKAFSSLSQTTGFDASDQLVFKEVFEVLKQGVESYGGLFALCVDRIKRVSPTIDVHLALGSMVIASIYSNKVFSEIARLLPDSLTSAAKEVLRSNLASLLPCPLYNISL